jgi:hypothetical protein
MKVMICSEREKQKEPPEAVYPPLSPTTLQLR